METDKKTTTKHNTLKKSKDIPKNTIFAFSFFVFFVLIAIIPNFYYSLAMDQQLEIRIFALSISLIALLLPIIFTKKYGILKQNEIKIIKNPAVIIYAALIVLIGISIFWSTNKSEAIYEFLKRATFFILFIYLIIYILPKENSRLMLIRSFVLFSLIISVTGIIQILEVFSITKYNLEALYLITGNFAQKNIFSEVLFITFAFSIYGAAIFDKIWKKLAIIGTLLNLLLIAFIMTRAIWAAFFIALTFTFILYIFFASKTLLANKLKLVLRYFAIIFGVVIITVIAVSAVDKNKTLQSQITNAFDFKQGNTFHRLNLWKKSLSLAEKNPILGVGAGNWRIEILQYDLQVTTDKGRVMPDRTHNDYLQLLVENGIIGLILFILMFAILLYYCIKILKKAEKFEDSFFILILFFALVGYMVDSCFAFPRERIELQIFLNIIFAYIVFEYHKTFEKEKESKSQISVKAIAAILLCLLSISSYAAYKRLQSEVGVKKIYRYNKFGNHQQIIKTCNEIYSPFSTISPFCDPIMQIKAISMYQNKNDLNLVFETFDKSLKDSPYHLETLNGLAVVYKNEKDYSKALEYCNTALKYAPTDNRTKILKADILLSENKNEEAYIILRTIDPQINRTDYKNAVNYILYGKVRNIVSQTKNEYFISELGKASQDNPDLFYKMFVQSINKNQDFEQTLLEKIFSICNQDKILKDKSLEQLKIKYKVKK
ncbi:MAG: O-antigen ligase family protein [Bacteroidales bacterium]